MFQAAILAAVLLAPAQQAQPPKTLKAMLTEVSRKAEIYAVAVKALESLPVSGPAIEDVTQENVEELLLATVKKLSIPSRAIKLYLPKTDRQWTADEILAYARAEATLLKKTVGEIKPGTIEVLGTQVPVEKGKPVIETLNLRAVYVIVMAQANFSGTWDTTYGTMKLTQQGNRVTGTYTTNGGQITGDVVGTELRFIWFESGNSNGGRGTFVLSDDAMSFSGPWFTHENSATPAGTWTGRRSRTQPAPQAVAGGLR